MGEFIPIVMFLSIAAVLILRPLTTKLGSVLEHMAHSRRDRGLADADVASLRASIDHVGKRLELMEERLDFTEKLLSRGYDAAEAPRLEVRSQTRSPRRL